MKIKKFESHKYIGEIQDPYYEIYYSTMIGDNCKINLTDDDFIYNPFDLNDIIELYIKYFDKYTNNKSVSEYYIKKISEELVDLESIPEIALRITSKKYNI